MPIQSPIFGRDVMTIDFYGRMPTDLDGHDQDFLGSPKILMGMPTIFLGVPIFWAGTVPSI